MDCIHIENLEIFARHGVYEEENRLGQLFIVSADLHTETRAAALGDNLDLSVNYGNVCHFIGRLMTEKTFRLIESAAEYIASAILTQYPSVRAVDVTLKKPWAPIGMHLDWASVTIHRKKHRVYIGIGSNMGDSAAIIREALAQINHLSDTKITACSDFIVTKPYGGVAQNDFLNGCAELETLKAPEELLDTLMQIEKLFGRERLVHWGPRTLDLDILLYDDEIIGTKRLTVPHADMQNRLFVLGPLNEIAGYVRHPVYLKTINQMYNELLKKEEKHD